MNVPNTLTMMRILTIPVMTVLYYIGNPDGETLSLYALIIACIFVGASLTDFLDGYIARKQGTVTTLGKFLDPLADKLLVMFALLLLLDLALIPMWIVLIILTREFFITGIRLVANMEGVVVVASPLGKAKTAVTMVGLIMLMFYVTWGIYVLYVGLILTIWSAFDYVWKNRQLALKKN